MANLIIPLFRKDKKWLTWLLLLFAVSRLTFYFAGIRFDSNSITLGTWQLINPELLQTRLLESLTYLHSQPPLYNLYIGLVLKLSPAHYNTVFYLNYMFIGLVITVLLFKIMIQFEIPKWIAFSLTLLFIISPSAILYENWLSYTYPIVALLTCSIFFLLRFYKSQRIIDGVIFFSILATIILTRSMFHLVWFLAIVVLLISFQQIPFRKIILTASIPFLLVTSIYIKNYALFGSFSTSTWMGMNLYEIVFSRTDREDLIQCVSNNELKPIVLVPSFWSLDHYKPFISKPNPYPTIRVLTDSTNLTHANYNHYDFIDISNQYKTEAIHAVKLNPKNYLKNVVLAFGYYCYPASDYPLLKKNIGPIFWYNKIYNHAILWTLFNPDEIEREPPFKIEYALSLSLLIIIGFLACCVLAVRSVFSGNVRKYLTSNLAAVISYIVLTIVYVMVIGNFFEQGENMRFRFQTSTLQIILLGILLSRLLKAIKNRYNPV